jgi:adiponectin receptor
MKDVGTSPFPSSNETTLVNTPESSTPEEETLAFKDITSKAIDKVNSLLRAFHEAPTYQQDNHFIIRGYRGELNSFKRCFDSLWYVHNETGSQIRSPPLTEVNIWSHLLGAIGFGLLAGFTSSNYLQRYPTSSSADISVFACFFGGAVICLGFSASVRSIFSRL